LSDADGFVFLTDRKKDLIIRGGENISPREVEQVLASFPGVAEAAVVGAPDREWGEAVVAFLVLREGRDVSSETLEAFCRERLARFKVPARMEVVASLPLTSLGKVDKAGLRRAAAGVAEAS
jgi:long-chain acyl-CoA synthetase